MSDRLMQYILDDVNKYDGVRRMLKSSILERLLTDEVAVKKMHPNPADEFCDEKIGPNLEIVSSYEKILERAVPLKMPIFEERIYVEKMSPNGYLILNGHHRWAAAYRRGVKKVRVRLVNVTHEADVRRVMLSTNNSRRATLDMDEFVFAADTDEKEPLNPISAKLFGRRMRLGIPALILELQRKGYDIWVYTADYHSREYLDRFFRAHGVKVTGIVNGLSESKANRTKKKQELIEAISKKYEISITFSKDVIIYTNAATKEYEMVDIIPTEKGNLTKQIFDEICKIEEEHEGEKSQEENK